MTTITRKIIARLVGITIIAIVILTVSIQAVAKRQNLESYYVDKYCHGIIEYVLPDKARVDCLLDETAQEFDFGDKWAECIGQAMHYGAMTARRPECVLILEHQNDVKYLNRAKFVAAAYINLNLKITVIKNEEIICVANCDSVVYGLRGSKQNGSGLLRNGSDAR